jgi:molybdate transport system substrate-binding protein
MTMNSLIVQSGVAAQGIVGQLQRGFGEQQDCRVEAQFGAVGTIVDRLRAGAPCDVMILTGSLISRLASEGLLRAGSARALGTVKTGLAVKAGAPRPAVNSAKALEEAFLQANAIYFPDPVKATAGIHFMKVLAMLGIHEQVESRLRAFPDGAAAMAALAAAPAEGSLGCTQVTEIIYTPGGESAGALPRKFELTTMYTAAVCSRSKNPQAAAAFVELLAGASTRGVRQEGGFEEG